MTRRILVPVDGSKTCLNSFRNFLENYYQEGDYFIIAHFYVPPSLPTFTLKNPLTLPWEEWGKIMKSTTERVMNILSVAEDIILTRRIKGHTYSRVGSAQQGIINYCKTQDVDMIIMSARQHSTLTKMLIGSTTEYVIHNSLVPVMVYPAYE